MNWKPTCLSGKSGKTGDENVVNYTYTWRFDVFLSYIHIRSVLFFVFLYQEICWNGLFYCLKKKKGFFFPLLIMPFNIQTLIHTTFHSFHYCTFFFSALSLTSLATHSATEIHPSLLLFDHLFRVLVHSFDEGTHVLWFHVGVKAMAQVGDVAPGAETLQHLLHDVWNSLLKEEKRGEKRVKVKDQLAFDIFRLVLFHPQL